MAVRQRWGGRVQRTALALAAWGVVATASAQDIINGPPLPLPAEPVAPQRVPGPPPGQAESLGELLARALPHDPAVKVAAAQMAATDQRRLQAQSRLGPTASVSVVNGRALEDEFGNALKRHTDRAEASLRWNLYNAGNDVAELGGAVRDVEAAWQDLRRAREDAAERIADAYLELLRVEGLLPLAAARLASVQRLVAQVLQQNQAGKVSDAEAEQARASQLDAEIALEQVEAERDSARQKLGRLVGDVVRPVLPADLPAPLVLDGRPGSLLAATLRAEAARARVRPLASLLAPRIDLEARNSLSDQTRPQQTTTQQRMWLLTARWDLPLGGEAQARRSEVERRAEAAEAEAERLAMGVRAELDALLPTIDNTARAVSRLDQQIAQYTNLVKAGELQFEAGRRTLAQLIQLHDSRFNAQQRRADQQRKLQSAQLRRLSLSGALLPAFGLGSAP